MVVGVGENKARTFEGRGCGEPLIDMRTIPAMVDRLCELRPDAAPFLIDPAGGRSWSPETFVLGVRRLAARLADQHHVRPGDRVMICSRNIPEAFFAHVAVMYLGAITAPVSPTDTPDQFRHLCRLTSPVLWLRGPCSEDLAQAMGEQAQDLVGVFAAAQSEAQAYPAGADVDPQAPAAIITTSGTTSSSKGVCLTHYNLAINAEALRRVHDLERNRVHLCILPLYHGNAFGLSMVTSIYAGCQVILMDGFPGPAIWDVARQHRPQILSATPSVLQALSRRRAPCDAVASFSHVISAAAPLSPAVARAFVAVTGVPVHQGYGLSECTNFATATPVGLPADTYQALLDDDRLSIGPAVFGNAVEVLDRQGRPCGEGEEGELHIRGHNVMLGYWGDAEATGAALGAGALVTGDIGYFKTILGQRYYYISGRRKEIIIRYGENHSPAAIELTLARLSEIAPFAVCGFENSHCGEEIGLYLHCARTPQREARVRAILEACGRHARPRVVLFGTSPVPTTVTGKVRRSELRTRFAAYAEAAMGDGLVFSEHRDAAAPRAEAVR